MKQKMFMKKTENSITMLSSLIIHMKENMFRLIVRPKASPLTRTIISLSSPLDGPASPYVVVFYQATAKISNDSKILCHGNAKKRVSLEKRTNIRTNDQILSKARELSKHECH